MNLYLFPALSDDPVVGGLQTLRDEGAAPVGLYTRLIDFAGTWGYTDRTVREYLLRLLLRGLPGCRDTGAVLPYLRADVTKLYRLFYETDWNAVCEQAGLLPLPGFHTGAAPGEPVYKALIRDMMAAGSAGALCDAVVAFARGYRGEDEAMYRAFRWDGSLKGVAYPSRITFDDLCGLEHQKAMLLTNTRAFLGSRPANNVLLVGGSGTGKSSCVKATLNCFAGEGLKLVEFGHEDLTRLPDLLAELGTMRQRYLVFIDDLSFEGADQRYLALKVALEGGASERPANVLIYATSNRRHLVRETWRDREGEEDIHQNDTVHEKLSLAERFGIRLTFSTLSKEEFLGIVHMHLDRAGIAYDADTDNRAMAWATENSGRSGRTAQQFAMHYISEQQ